MSLAGDDRETRVREVFRVEGELVVSYREQIAPPPAYIPPWPNPASRQGIEIGWVEEGKLHMAFYPSSSRGWGCPGLVMYEECRNIDLEQQFPGQTRGFRPACSASAKALESGLQAARVALKDYIGSFLDKSRIIEKSLAYEPPLPSTVSTYTEFTTESEARNRWEIARNSFVDSFAHLSLLIFCANFKEEQLRVQNHPRLKPWRLCLDAAGVGAELTAMIKHSWMGEMNYGTRVGAYVDHRDFSSTKDLVTFLKPTAALRLYVVWTSKGEEREGIAEIFPLDYQPTPEQRQSPIEVALSHSTLSSWGSASGSVAWGSRAEASAASSWSSSSLGTEASGWPQGWSTVAASGPSQASAPRMKTKNQQKAERKAKHVALHGPRVKKPAPGYNASRTIVGKCMEPWESQSLRRQMIDDGDNVHTPVIPSPREGETFQSYLARRFRCCRFWRCRADAVELRRMEERERIASLYQVTHKSSVFEWETLKDGVVEMTQLTKGEESQSLVRRCCKGGVIYDPVFDRWDCASWLNPSQGSPTGASGWDQESIDYEDDHEYANSPVPEGRPFFIPSDVAPEPPHENFFAVVRVDTTDLQVPPASENLPPYATSRSPRPTTVDRGRALASSSRSRAWPRSPSPRRGFRRTSASPSRSGFPARRGRSPSPDDRLRRYTGRAVEPAAVSPRRGRSRSPDDRARRSSGGARRFSRSPSGPQLRARRGRSPSPDVRSRHPPPRTAQRSRGHSPRAYSRASRFHLSLSAQPRSPVRRYRGPSPGRSTVYVPYPSCSPATPRMTTLVNSPVDVSMQPASPQAQTGAPASPARSVTSAQYDDEDAHAALAVTPATSLLPGARIVTPEALEVSSVNSSPSARLASDNAVMESTPTLAPPLALAAAQTEPAQAHAEEDAEMEPAPLLEPGAADGNLIQVVPADERVTGVTANEWADFVRLFCGYRWPNLGPANSPECIPDKKFPKVDDALLVVGFPETNGIPTDALTLVNNFVVQIVVADRQERASVPEGARVPIPAATNLPYDWNFQPDHWELSMVGEVDERRWDISTSSANGAATYYVLQPLGDETPNRVVAIRSPLVAINVHKRSDLPTLDDVVKYLLRIGAEFYDLSRRNAHLSGNSLRWMQRSDMPPLVPPVAIGSVSDQYRAYEAQVSFFLGANPRVARRCIMSGGILRKIVFTVLGNPTYASLLSGPTEYAHLTDVRYSLQFNQDFEFVDDDLEESEIHYICGLCSSGASWWPTPEQCRGTFLDSGFWSPRHSQWFERRRDEQLDNTGDGPKKGWRATMIGGDRRTARFYFVVNEMGRQCLENY